MSPELTAALEILTIILLALQLAATVAIAWIVDRSAGKVARVNVLRSLRETWINIDFLALRDDRTLKIADSLLPHPDTPKDDGFARKRLFLLAYINPIATWYDAAEEGIYGDKTADNLDVVRGLLRGVLQDDDAFWVTQEHWYGPGFQALCKELKHSLPPRSPNC